MISFLENTEHWENTEVELATRGVRDISARLSLSDRKVEPRETPISLTHLTTLTR